MKKGFIHKLVFLAFFCITSSAFAEDIDLFVGSPPASNELPNVLFIIDNTANWATPISNTTRFAEQIGALSQTIQDLPVNADGSANFNVGIMFFAKSPVKGAYVRAAIRPLDSTYKTKFKALIDSFHILDDRGANALYGYSMAEAYRYFMGQLEYVGADEPLRDYKNNNTGTAPSKAIYALDRNAFPTASQKTYNSPITQGCQKNFIIYISNGKIDSSDKDDIAPSTQCPKDLKSCTARDLLRLAGGNTTTIPISAPNNKESTSMANEWAYFMKQSTLAVSTYVIDIGPTDASHTALMKSMAGVSGGKYFEASVSATEISKALNSIFSEIRSVNSVFASVSLPISVNTQGTYLNQVFIGMFRPDQYPRWAGNLKQYKLGLDGDILKLVDADENSAVNYNTGFIAECARSQWTPDAPDTYWSFKPQGDCIGLSTDISNNPDGNIVEKGAQAYRSRLNTTRNLKTCSPIDCNTLSDFNSTTVTQAMLGATSSAEQQKLINWLRGLDEFDENSDGARLSQMRPSLHGDVVHSRPVAINYGDPDDLDNTSVVVFYGGNDGILRAVNGNREDKGSIGGKAPGDELWGFVAPEFYKQIKRISENTTSISFPNNTITSPAPLPKPYGVDGPITAYKDDDRAWLFATMRRGGRAFYAFDVTSPSNPSLKWRIGCNNLSNDDGCDAGFSDLGQTWSSIKVTLSAGYGAGDSPLIIAGGGYDNCHDADPNTGCSTSSKGNRIYIIDADTGQLLKNFETLSSVVGDITIVPDKTTRQIVYAYAADLGGNIYRISGANASSPIGNTPPANWTMTRIASLGGTGVNNRKFMYGPDVLDDNDGYILLLGSGDREKPIASYTAAANVQNYFFMIKDYPTNSTWLSSETTTCGASRLCLDSLLMIDSNDTPTSDALNAKKGWALALRNSEQVVTSAVTLFNTVTFSTQQTIAAEVGTCGLNLGKARVYNVNYLNAASRNGTLERGEVIAGGGLPPSPVGGIIKLDDGQLVPFIIGASPNSPLESRKVSDLLGLASDPPWPKRYRGKIFWNIKK